MKKFLFCMIGTMMSLLCCGTKAPEGQLVLLEYTESGTMAGYEYFGRVEKQPNGTFVVIAMKESYGDLYQKKIGKEELEKLKQIIVEEKMMKYKEHYRPVFEVLDGYMWHFEATFSEGARVYSSGSNARPGGDGLKRVREYLTELVADATKTVDPEKYR